MSARRQIYERALRDPQVLAVMETTDPDNDDPAVVEQKIVTRRDECRKSYIVGRIPVHGELSLIVWAWQSRLSTKLHKIRIREPWVRIESHTTETITEGNWHDQVPGTGEVLYSVEFQNGRRPIPPLPSMVPIPAAARTPIR